MFSCSREGFGSFHVEHAELMHMGQLGILGRYPLHWHMAGQLQEGDSSVANNSIHHTLQVRRWSEIVTWSVPEVRHLPRVIRLQDRGQCRL